MVDRKGEDRRRARILVDVVMAALFVGVMASALVQETPHEYLGIALFIAVVAHVVLNRRWLGAILRGRYNVVRVPQLVTVIGLLLCITGQVASSLILSKFAFGFLPTLPGASWARRVHMLCSYWSFVFAFAHAGLHLRSFGLLVRPKKTKGSNGKADASATTWVVRLVLAAVVCFGACSFVTLGLGVYLLGRVQFAFADFSEPIVLSFARYTSVAALIVVLFAILRRTVERGC